MGQAKFADSHMKGFVDEKGAMSAVIQRTCFLHHDSALYLLFHVYYIYTMSVFLLVAHVHCMLCSS